MGSSAEEEFVVTLVAGRGGLPGRNEVIVDCVGGFNCQVMALEALLNQTNIALSETYG